MIIHAPKKGEFFRYRTWSGAGSVLVSAARRTCLFPCRGILGHGVFGLFPLQDQIEQRFCLVLRAKAADLICTATKLAEETFQQVCGTDHTLVRKRDPQVVEGQIKVFNKAAYRFGFKRSPFLLKVNQALFDNDDIRIGVEIGRISQNGTCACFLGLLACLTVEQIWVSTRFL